MKQTIQIFFLLTSFILFSNSSCSVECDESLKIEKKELHKKWGNEDFKIKFNSNGTFVYSEKFWGSISGKWSLNDRTILLNFNNSGGNNNMHEMKSKIDEMYVCRRYHEKKMLVRSNIFGHIELISI